MPPPRQISQTLHLPPPPADAAELFFVFHLTRGRLERVRVEPLDGGHAIDFGPPPLHIFEGPLPRNAARIGLVSRTRVTLPRRVRLEVAGERAEPATAIYLDASGQILAVMVAAGDACPGSSEATWSQVVGPYGSIDRYLVTPFSYLAELESAVTNGPATPVGDYRRFFAELDRQTHPNLVPEVVPPPERQDRLDAIAAILEDLLDRIIERKQKSDGGSPCPRLDHEVYPNHRRFVPYLSKLQRDLTQTRFADAAGRLDLATFEEAFQMFANGELRVKLPSGLWACQPSSGYFYCFAEFALLVEDMEAADPGFFPAADVDFWRQVANVMVRSQAIMSEVYKPASIAGADAGFEDYHACNYDRARTFTCLQKGALWRQYCGLTIDGLCIEAGKNAARFLGGIDPPAAAGPREALAATPAAGPP